MDTSARLETMRRDTMERLRLIDDLAAVPMQLTITRDYVNEETQAYALAQDVTR